MANEDRPGRYRNAAWSGANGEATRDLALRVSRCSAVDDAQLDPGHPCRKIVSLQSQVAEEWQVPEAWAGNLTGASIVFVASNPSISEAGEGQSPVEAEDYPRGSWSDDAIADFVTHRFDSEQGWATQGGRFRTIAGHLSATTVTFWVGARNRAAELLCRPADPSTDYVMTEVVHCKSKGERGVKEATRTCADRHLDRILAASPAPLVVILGAKARDLLVPRWELPVGFGTKATSGTDEGANTAVRTVGGRLRVIVYLWHPSGMTGPKTFQGAYPTQLDDLRRLVAGDMPPQSFASNETGRVVKGAEHINVRPQPLVPPRP